MTAVLNEFRLEQGVYRLGQFTPVSIRDQIVRAGYLVEHLAASGELSEDSRLLVIGAGAAGMTAAILALRKGVQRVTLVERTDTVMSLQARTSSRWLDPVQYDWPASHWMDAEWPLTEHFQVEPRYHHSEDAQHAAPHRDHPFLSSGPDTYRHFTAVNLPFRPLKAATAEELAIEFQNRTVSYFHSRIKGRFSTEVEGWRRSPMGRLEVGLTHTKTKAHESVRADVVIVAIGFGLEQASIGDSSSPGAPFQGLDFWSTDKFEQPSMGLSARKQRVLVSGAGDGALQDFIRLSTGQRSAREVLKGVWSAIKNNTWKERVIGLWHWNEQASRSRAFAPNPITECAILNRLHKRYSLEIDKLADSADWPAVVTWLDSITANRQRGSVRLVFKCRHFGWCYPLNRLVALLIARYMQEQDQEVLLFGTAVRSTTPIAHNCGPQCWGRRHKVSLANYVECEHTAAELERWPADQSETAEVQGLVIRHGIDAAQIGARTLSRMKPQNVPFHLP